MKVTDLQFTDDGTKLIAVTESGIFVWSLPKP